MIRGTWEDSISQELKQQLGKESLLLLESLYKNLNTQVFSYLKKPEDYQLNYVELYVGHGRKESMRLDWHKDSGLHRTGPVKVTVDLLTPGLDFKVDEDQVYSTAEGHAALFFPHFVDHRSPQEAFEGQKRVTLHMEIGLKGHNTDYGIYGDSNPMTHFVQLINGWPRLVIEENPYFKPSSQK